MLRDRPARLLRRAAAGGAPRQHVVVSVACLSRELSTEPYGCLETLRLGHAAYFEWRRQRVTNRQSLTFDTVETFWRRLGEVVRPRSSTWVWLPESDRDFAVLRGWHARESGILTQGNLVADERLWVYFCSLSKCPVVFLALTNWLKSTVTELAALVGLEAPALPDPWDDDHCWSAWCAQRLQVASASVERVLAWHGENRLGPLSVTAAGQSLRLYEARAGQVVESDRLPGTRADQSWHQRRPCLYPIPHHCADALTLERAAYCGLMPDVFRLGPVQGPVTCLDATSYYPSLMRAHLFPARLLDRLRRPRIADLRRWSRAHGLIAVCRVETGDYPYCCRMPGGTLRALGHYWTVLSGPEIAYALDNDELRECSVAHVYTLRPLFVDYVNAVLGMRQHARERGDRIGEILSKTLANSLHGKFGQRMSRWTLERKTPPRRTWGTWIETGSGIPVPIVRRSVGGDVQRQLAPAEAIHSFPAIPAYVCALARLRLFSLWQAAGAENVLYSHVDSLHVLNEGLERLLAAGLVDPNVPGQLRIDKEWSEVHYYGPARYIADGVPTVSGLSAGACRVDPLQWEQEAVMRTAQLTAQRPPDGAIVTRRRLSIVEHIRAGSVRRDGWVVPAYLDTAREGPPPLEWLEQVVDRNG